MSDLVEYFYDINRLNEVRPRRPEQSETSYIGVRFVS